MKKNCIFNTSKICNNCGECDTCDITPDKKCNNCGKCLEMEGYDIKAIQIDQVFEETGEYDENLEEIESSAEVDTEETDMNHSNDDELTDDSDNVDDDINDRNYHVEYIDDVEEIRDALDGADIIDPSAQEVFPGLIIMNKKHS